MKRAIFIFLVTVLLMSSAYAESVFEQAVPFGLIDSEEPVDVYSLPAGGEPKDTLMDGQVVVILNT